MASTTLSPEHRQRTDSIESTEPLRDVRASLAIPPGKIAAVLACMIAVLVLLSAVCDFIIAMVGIDSGSPLVTLAKRFIFDSELNLPTWYSSITLFACAAVLAWIAYAHRVARHSDWLPWSALALLFAAMSLDEAASFHELPSGFVKEALSLDGVLKFGWVVLAIPAVLAVGLLFLRFLWRLPARTRRLFLGAGGCYLSAVLGMEIVGGMLAEWHGMRDPIYLAVASVEEVLEMTGVALFLYALLDYLGRSNISLNLHIAPAEGLPQ